MPDTSSVVVDYTLHPPQNVASPSSVKPSTSHQFPLKHSVADESHAAYYEALGDAVRLAQTTIGQEMTIWRDAVESEEKSKDPKKRMDEEEDDDQEDDEVVE